MIYRNVCEVIRFLTTIFIFGLILIQNIGKNDKITAFKTNEIRLKL